MRDIKFRQFDNLSGKMRTEIYNSWWNPKEYPLMQFTGLQDKNGVDIYESDIIKSHFYGDEITCIAEIKYDQSSAAYIYDSSEQDAFIYGAEQGVLEVIGNIHENKECLK